METVLSCPICSSKDVGIYSTTNSLLVDDYRITCNACGITVSLSNANWQKIDGYYVDGDSKLSVLVSMWNFLSREE